MRELLAGIDLFAHCSPDEAAGLAAISRGIRLPAGAALFKEGDRSDAA
jgi:hypothetical protein